MTATICLGELRALRDAYAQRACRALEQRWRKPMGALICECARAPYKHRDGIAVLADSLTDMTDWAALTRFIWLAELVWERESEALACLPQWKARAA